MTTQAGLIGADTESFWRIMRRQLPGVFFAGVDFIPPELESRTYQLFEVLAVYALQRLEPSLVWRVSPAHKDHGLDFTAHGTRLVFPTLDLEIQPLLVGQVKRERSLRWEQLVVAVDKIRRNWAKRPIFAVVFVLSSRRLRRAELEASLNDPSKCYQITSASYVIDGERILQLLAGQRDAVIAVLHQCLEPAELSVVASTLDGLPSLTGGRLDVTVSGATFGQTGRPVRVRLVLRQLAPVPRFDIRLRYRPSPDERNRIEIVRPTQVAGAGVELTLRHAAAQSIDLWLRCFAPGRRRLGCVEVESLGGTPLESVDLGVAELERVFEPPFFLAGNADVLSEAMRHARTAANGGVAAAAIVGSGGIGKSRLCVHVLDDLADHGFQWISLGNENTPSAGSGLLRALVLELVPPDNDPEQRAGDGTNALRSSGLGLPDDTLEPLGALFGNTPRIDASGHTLVKGIFALLVLALQDRPLALHLHDLHWADRATLAVVRSLLDHLRANRGGLPHGVLLLFEGRDREALPVEGGGYATPRHWHDFLAAGGFATLRLRAWKPEHCEEFLHHVIPHHMDAGNPIREEDVPLRDALISHVLARATGNPMHLVEQLKYLHTLEVLEYAPNGYLYLRRRPPTDLQVPESIEGLIHSRIAFYRERMPELVSLLAVSARIGNAVPGHLLAHVLRRVGVPNARAALRSMDFVEAPDGIAAGLSFLHENYYRCFLNEPVAHRSSALADAIKWYEQIAESSLADRTRLGRLYLALDPPPYTRVAAALRPGIAQAEEAQDELQAHALLRVLLEVPEQWLNKAGIDVLRARYQLACATAVIGSWREAFAELEGVVARCKQHPRGGSPHAVTLEVQATAKMVDTMLAFQANSAAAAVADAGRATVAAALATGTLSPQERVELLRWEAELCHRKAVAIWFNGGAVDAARWQLRALSVARQHGIRTQEVIALREIGTLLLHRNPQLGLRVLERARRAAVVLAGSIHYTEHLIIAVQSLLGELIAAQHATGESRAAVESVADRAAEVYARCTNERSIYDAAVCSLVSGAAAGLLGHCERAHLWFSTAVSIATLAALEEEIWKARINLAQVCAELGEHEAARMHACEAQSVLRAGLSKIGNRPGRRKLLVLPLCHSVRLGASLEIALSALGISRLPEWFESWNQRPSAVTTTGQSQQVLHVRRTSWDYFLMN